MPNNEKQYTEMDKIKRSFIDWKLSNIFEEITKEYIDHGQFTHESVLEKEAEAVTHLWYKPVYSKLD